MLQQSGTSHHWGKTTEWLTKWKGDWTWNNGGEWWDVCVCVWEPGWGTMSRTPAVCLSCMREACVQPADMTQQSTPVTNCGDSRHSPAERRALFLPLSLRVAAAAVVVLIPQTASSKMCVGRPWSRWRTSASSTLPPRGGKYDIQQNQHPPH